ncbi:MAG: glycosyltransferase [Candidatus Limnocylindria bacterium]
MRVLNIIGTLEVGGTEQYLSRVIPLLRRGHGIGIDLWVLDRRGPLLEPLEAAGVAIFGARTPHRSGLPFMYAAATTALQMARLIRRRRYDIVHSYLFHAEVLGTVAARLARCPRTIISRRAVYPWRRPGGFIWHFLETMTNVLADEVIANSRAVLEDARRTEHRLPRRSTVIWNGVDVSCYRVADPRNIGSLRLVTVGALADRKGQEYVVDALRLIRDAGVEANLTIVGTGPNESLLRRMVAERQLAENVVFAGLQVDPRPWLLDADLFVLPSRQEGFSNALLEAMASGLPAVATDVGGNAEAVVHGEGGLIVPPRDSEAIARAVVELDGRRGELATMGRANRARVEALFSLEASVDRLASWYRGGDESRPELPATARS